MKKKNEWAGCCLLWCQCRCHPQSGWQLHWQLLLATVLCCFYPPLFPKELSPVSKQSERYIRKRSVTNNGFLTDLTVFNGWDIFNQSKIAAKLKNLHGSRQCFRTKVRGWLPCKFFSLAAIFDWLKMSHRKIREAPSVVNHETAVTLFSQRG